MEIRLMKLISIFIFILFVIKPTSQNASQAIESVARLPVQFRNQLLTDLYMVRGSLNHLQNDLDELGSRLNIQNEVIRSIKLQSSLSENAIDACEMDAFFYNIDSKLIKIKQKVQQVINDNDDQHMDNLDKIMHNVRKSSLDCSMDGHELFVAFQTNITSKLEEFDRQMQRLNILEERLIKSGPQEMKVTESNESLTKLLNDINDKLDGQAAKLKELEFYIPLMVNSMHSVEAFKESQSVVCKKQKCISEKILKLTHAQLEANP